VLEGFYTAASGVLMQERTLNVLANNMANIRTPGFRSERVISNTFDQTLLICRENGQDRLIGKGSPVRLVSDVATIYEETSLEETNRPFDMALVGAGYFNIQASDGQTYLTRNGNFDVDEEGFLVLRGMGRVLGEEGPIEIGLSDRFTVDDDGTVKAADGTTIDKLLITDPMSGTNDAGAATTAAGTAAPMTKYANGLYTVTDPEANLPAEGVRVYQKQLERANLDLNREYTLVMEAQRTFQSCANALRTIDEINAKSAAQIASIG